ncbi:DUF1836 domain-containing protein [Dorea acetigenes]|jgi:DNA-binding transcriptional MerR regulator|uniref:DUF1836 domain-containing protein n=1 Tax=Dorea acetigenes TaxID=2981787 RepID=A0ABT2RMK9_9FIRM|nr:DUF1836 domain-containing protein [Dorea acetigenes]MCB6413575.1 DUF1836 domain-containing protein [Faecalimonas umbilicata]MCU6686639.1 DUF1836 domain-containing protein [Dorea acetigenes]SCJ03766.1 Domain of uncharacterised function (DUF1836) [uncultured Clostridium sp.]
MTIDTKDMLNSILTSISKIDYVKPEDIPNIDLYMDQVTTFMEAQLSSTKRYPEDKILTKTMINNYAKNNLLPPPVKKKYSREHVLLLIFIYYFKNILSIKDIETLLAPVTEENFNNGEDFSLTDIYKEICQHEKSRTSYLAKDIAHSFKAASETFSNAPEEDRRSLQQFSFICSLAFDVYVKKQLIEKLIDEMPEPEHKKKKK